MARSLEDLLVLVRDTLRREGPLSINDLSRRLRAQWRTIRKVLRTLVRLEVVEEVDTSKVLDNVRVFRLRIL